MKGGKLPLVAVKGDQPLLLTVKCQQSWGRMNLCAQHHTVLSLECSLSTNQRCGVFALFGFCCGRQLCQGLYCLRAYFCTYIFLCANHCFSMLQHAAHTIVVLDTAWPWASEAYGLCRLCAYFCARKIGLYAQDHTALSFYRPLLQASYKGNSGAGYCLALGQ